MGGSASYRLAKKIEKARASGVSDNEINELERQRQTAREAERQKRKNKKGANLRLFSRRGPSLGTLNENNNEQWNKAVSRAEQANKIEDMRRTRLDQMFKRRGSSLLAEMMEEDWD